MVKHYLDFEKPLIELEIEIDHLKRLSHEKRIHSEGQLRNLEEKLQRLRQDIFANLTPWQITQMARHIDRPKTSHYIRLMSEGFIELHGDRIYGDDPAIMGGVGRFNGRSIVLMGHQKGTDAREMVDRNFGMPHPEGYRKALRLMKMAELFKKPILTFIDTPGAYPGVGAEERGQAEAIARNLRVMVSLRTPIITAIIGEGGSGGALAIGVGDRLLMLEYSIYSVISPEGCAAILWKDSAQRERAADALKLTAQDLLRLKLIDEIIPEPVGGAHVDPDAAGEALREALIRHVTELRKIRPEKLVRRRAEKYGEMGVFTEM